MDNLNLRVMPQQVVTTVKLKCSGRYPNPNTLTYGLLMRFSKRVNDLDHATGLYGFIMIQEAIINTEAPAY